ncbi:MAG: VOC family protein [Aeromonas sp.]
MLSHLDHLVLTVADIDRAQAFYQRVLQMTPISFGAGRKGLLFGQAPFAQKINLHTLGQETRNHAAVGSADLCLITHWPLARVQAHLVAQGVTILEGPVTRTGAGGKMQSIYCRDPDGNLLELSHYGV